MNIGVLGAGIVGFNTALAFQNEFPNAQITIIANKFDEDTVSYGAAGIFRPGIHFAGPTLEITKQWIKDSYNFYNEILGTEESDKAGVLQVSGYIFSEENEFVTRNAFLEEILPVYRHVNEDELNLCPGKWKYGSFSTTLVIEPGYFLRWARMRFEAKGGKVICQEIKSFEDFQGIKPLFDVLFNCTGFGAKWLCNDSKMIPVRGQVIKVRAPWIKMFYYNEYDTYIVPGRDTVTLGGCRQLESYNTSISVHDSASIWERCTALVPSLKKAEVIKEWVGLRPYRDIVRVELETKQIGDQQLKIIHNYGHGGYGITTAPGTSKYSVELLRDYHRRSNQAERYTSTCASRVSKL